MGLSDFERDLAAESSRPRESHHRSKRERSRSRDRDREHRHRHHHHRSHRHRDEDEGSERRHRHKRHRDRDDDDSRRHRKRHRSDSPRPEKKRQEEVKVFDSDDEDEWVEKEAETAPPEEETLDARPESLQESKVQRDAWMQEPSALDVDYVQRSKKQDEPKSQFVGAKENHEFKVHQSDVNRHLKDLERDFDSDGDEDGEEQKVGVKDEPAQHEVSYTFGDSGSSWRMTKLKAVYRKAEESKKPVEEVALETYGDLRAFDDAREEEREVDRRKTYGRDYVGLEKPSGELYQERKMKAGIRRPSNEEERQDDMADPVQGKPMSEAPPPARTAPLDTNALNKLKAQMMRAKLMKAPNAAQLEEEYNLATSSAQANNAQSDVVVLSNMENRQLAGDRSGEVTSLSGKRARERGLVEENEDMSIDDMVRNEKRTRGAFGGEGRNLAERIAKDAKFEDDLEYMDDNATKLSKKVVKSDMNLRNMAVGDFQKMQKILQSCPLCYHDQDSSDQPIPPQAPVISLATRTYLTLPTEPELAKYSAVIVPLQHRLNLLECDDDEWEEVRNFMKSLTRFYAAQDKSVIFYENAAFMHSRKGHAALTAIPLPHHLADTAPAYFKEAILSSDEQWSQHKPVIDTQALTQKPGYGKQAFRKALAKEMPYFHVWFTLDGGLGHVVEDERRWPKGDLFAREIIGGMLDKGPEVIKKQGRWERRDRRLESFRKRWEKFDWTKVLMEAQ